MNDNNLSPPPVKPLDDIINSGISAQELLNRCTSDTLLRQQCHENEQRWWTYLLQRDYPQWGVIDKAKEYYIRIAALHGIQLRNTADISQIPGETLFRQQRLENPSTLVLQLQVMDLEPFPISNVVARTYSAALSQFLDNLINYKVTDPAKWIFHINDEALGVDHTDINWPSMLNELLMVIFMDNVLDQQVIERLTFNIEAEAIASFDFLQCQGGLCDVLTITVSNRLKRLGDEASTGNIQLEPVKLVKVEFGVAPGYVLYYFQAFSNLLYNQDAFTLEIIEYFQDLIDAVPGISLSLMPRGYPFTKRQNLDKFIMQGNRDSRKLFHIDPLKKPKVFPDYLNASVFGKVDESDEHFQLWRSPDKPYPIITEYPEELVIIQRMEEVLPGILEAIRKLQQAFRQTFPNREAGFIVAGGMFSIIFDEYLSTETHWLMKTDVDFFVYGITHEWRVQAFQVLMKVLMTEYPMTGYTRYEGSLNLGRFRDNRSMTYSILKSVVTAQRYEYLDKDYDPIPYKTPNPDRNPENPNKRLDQYERSYAFQVINTNSKDGFEVIMNFDTSHIQVGFDCYDEWIATPYWELYYPRREALLVRYNIRGGRFVKALYRGFTLKTIMPYALLLKMTGTDYAGVIRKDRLINFKPLRSNKVKILFPDDLRPPSEHDFNHRPILRKTGYTKDLERIETGDPTELENPSRIGTGYVIGGYNQPLQRHATIITDLLDIFGRIKYDGQFKNGFDGYVNSEYLTFKIDAAPQEYDNRVKLSKFLLRDARILADSRIDAVEFSDPGTDAFRWSLMTEVLVHSKIREVTNGYHLRKFNSSSYASSLREENSARSAGEFFNNLLGPTNRRLMPTVIQKPPIRPLPEISKANRDSLLILESHGRNRSKLYSGIYTGYLVNPDKNRNLNDKGSLPRQNLALVAKAVENVDFPDPKIFSVVRPKNTNQVVKTEEYVNSYGYNKKRIIHQYFNFPIMVEGVVSFDTDEDFDSLDLHAPMLTDEQRNRLPLLTYEEFVKVATGKLKLDFKQNGYQYLVTFPASVSESIFLDEADWTMPLDRVLTDRSLSFNSICIFEYPIVESKDLNQPNSVMVIPSEGDEAYLRNPPSILKIFRSFLIVE